ncbi:MAG: hypothetical protein JWM36_2740 [Hyphomicrobiales bacterium]|nr:hypothetical protein [Hyphomicrobiales bacterium]
MKDNPELIDALSRELWLEDENHNKHYRRHTSLEIDQDGVSEGRAKELATKFNREFHGTLTHYVFRVVPG